MRLTCSVGLWELGVFGPPFSWNIPWSGHMCWWSWGESNPKFRYGSVLICVVQ